jgi:hypothetical protein
MALKSHDILLTSVDDLIARFKTASYKHTHHLRGKQDHFKIVCCIKDCQCVICKKQILKGQYAYARTVTMGMMNVPNNPYGYFGFKMCSEQCVEAVLKLLSTGSALGDIVMEDEKSRQLIMEAHNRP